MFDHVRHCCGANRARQTAGPEEYVETQLVSVYVQMYEDETVDWISQSGSPAMWEDTNIKKKKITVDFSQLLKHTQRA